MPSHCSGSFRTLSRERLIRPVRRAHESALRGSCYGLLGRGFVVLLLLLLFLFRQLLLLVLFLVFLATLVSHASSFFSDCDLKSITARLIIRNRREPTLPQLQSGRVTAAEPGFPVHSLTVQCKVSCGVSRRASSLLLIDPGPWLCRFPFRQRFARHSGSVEFAM